MTEAKAVYLTTDHAGDGLTALYQEYQGLVRQLIFNICGAEHLDDLVQEAWLRAWKGLPKFRQQASHKTWIYRIAVNTALDHCRRLKPALELFEEPAMNEGTEQRVANQELVQRALQKLSPEHRSVMVLSCYEDLSVREIAAVTESAEGTVKSRLHYARQQLKKFLSDNGANL